MAGFSRFTWNTELHPKKLILSDGQCLICRGRGFNPPLVLLDPQVFIDPRKNSQKYIADLPLVLPQIEYCSYTANGLYIIIIEKFKILEMKQNFVLAACQMRQAR